MIIKLCEAGHVPQAYEVIKRMSVRPITSFHLSYHLTAERRSKYFRASFGDSEFDLGFLIQLVQGRPMKGCH